MNILTVCKGNIHRSVVAEEFLRTDIRRRGIGDQYIVESRGLQGSEGTAPPEHPNLRGYPETYEPTRAVLADFGIEIPESKRSTPISRKDVEQADVILAIGADVERELLRRYHEQPALAAKIRLLADIPDPHGQNDPAYLKSVVIRIHDAVTAFVGTTVR